MGSSDEKCLLCFPLECGVTTLAVLTIIGTIACIVQACMSTDNLWEIYWPFVATSGIMSIIWIVALANPSE